MRETTWHGKHNPSAEFHGGRVHIDEQPRGGYEHNDGLRIWILFTNIRGSRPVGVVSNKSSLKIIFQDFQTVCIVLEVFFAASDFYLFCWCHDSLRQKVAHFRFYKPKINNTYKKEF